MTHLTMAQLLAVRDGDRSEPALSGAERHLADCAFCQESLEQLHQRTAHLRALPPLRPPRSVYPAVREAWLRDQQRQQVRRISLIGLAAAASLALWVVGSHLLAPPPLNAAAEIAAAQTSATVLEVELESLHPHQRVLDGGAVLVVLELEDRLAAVDQALAQLPPPVAISTPRLISPRRAAALRARVVEEVRLWQERESLIDALVRVHTTRSAVIEF